MPHAADGGGAAVRADVAAVLGPGELTAGSRLFADTDWSATPIGAPAAWSPTLRAAISTAMNTRFGMLVMAGPELVMVYNDGYIAGGPPVRLPGARRADPGGPRGG